MLSTVIGWRSQIRVTVTGPGTVISYVVHNVITRVGRNLLRDALRGEGDQDIKYMALGAGPTAASDEDLALEDERFRKQITSQQALINPGELLTTGFISEGEANDFTIEEVGWFSGAATEDPNTGILIARVLFNHTKNNLETLQIDRTDAIVEVT